MPDILPLFLAEATAPFSMCCCIVFGSGWQTDSETAQGHCSTKSSAAMAWAPEVPRKMTCSHLHDSDQLSAVFYLKKRHGPGTNYFLQHFKYGEHNNYLLLDKEIL